MATAAAAALLFTALPAAHAEAGPTATASGITLHLSPAFGPPGTKVTLTGDIPAAAKDPQQFGVINFGGFPDGFQINAGPITWSTTAPGHFTTQFAVPALPWLAPTGEVRLHAGHYAVGLQCFGVVSRGCGLRPDEASVSFRLTTPIPVSYKTPSLTVRPIAARPGAWLQVTGWAPLTEEFGQTLFGYDLVWIPAGQTGDAVQVGTVQQNLGGDLAGTVQLPASVSQSGGRGHLALEYTFTDLYRPQAPRGKGADEITLDPASFKILPPLRWPVVLPRQGLRSLSSNQNRGYFGALATSGPRLLVLADNTLWASSDHGHHWTRVPTPGLRPLVKRLGYQLLGGGGGLTTAPGFPNSLFASVLVASPQDGAPGTDVGLYSQNGGTTWESAPPPPGMPLTQFGGFAVEGSAVWAWWSGPRNRVAAEATSNGGRTWHRVRPACPASGSCLYLGPVPATDFGQMVAEIEPIVTVRHHAWVVVGSTVVNEGTPSELATLPGGAVLWVGNSSYPIQVSTDGGASWSYVATPTMPGAKPSPAGYPADPHLLPNGALLAQDPANGHYYELSPGSRTWRPVPARLMLANATTIMVEGSMVYWADLFPAPNTPPQVLAEPASRY
jgi:hypothetical protein